MVSDTNSTSPFSLKGDYPFLMKSQPKYRWWKPVAVAVVGLLIFTFFTALSVLIIYEVSGHDPQVQAVWSPTTDGSYMGGDQNDPFVLLVDFIPLALGIPSIAIAMRLFGLGGLKTLSSVEGGLRWKRFLSYIPLTFCLAVLVIAIETLIGVATGDSLGELTVVPIALLIIIVICPFQCAAEEYVFRGFLYQGFASWIPIVIIPLIIQAVLFASAHGYNSIGLLSVGFMALCSAWLATRTGGLEASISMHSVNNVISFGMSSLFVSQTTQANITIPSLICDLILIVAMTTILYWISKRKGYIEEKHPLTDAPDAPVAPVQG